MKYDFDTVIDRYNTYSMKYDGLRLNKRANEHTIAMMVADMDFRVAQPILDKLHETVEFGMFGYTGDFAEPAYAASVVHWWKSQYDCELDPKHIIYSNGTVEAVNCAIKAFSNVGDGVIIQRPVYGHFTSAIEEECHRKAVDNRLLCDENNYYTIDFDDLERKCADPNNRVLIFCSPANPVGRVWTDEEILRVAEITRKHNVLLISDEVHCDIRRAGITHTPILKIVEDTSNIIMLTAINKTFNLAGLACSNAIIPDDFLRARFKREFGMRMPTPFAISALIAAYNDGVEWMEQMNEYIDGTIDFALQYFAEKMPWVKVGKPEGTYCLWLDFSASGLSGEEIHRRIYDQANVFLQDGVVHDPERGQAFQRMCLPCARSVVKEAIDRIAHEFEDIG